MPFPRLTFTYVFSTFWTSASFLTRRALRLSGLGRCLDFRYRPREYGQALATFGMPAVAPIEGTVACILALAAAPDHL